MASSTNTVHVFPFELLPATAHDPTSLLPHLSPDERIRAESIHHTGSRSRFVQCRAVLRALLGRRIGAKPFLQPLLYQPGGKPTLAGNTPLPFNLAHSGDVAVIAITDNPHLRIGVDIEQLRPRPRAQAIAKRFFHPEETEHLASRPDSEQENEFLRLWVRKEACLKALGSGIEDMLATFSVVNAPNLVSVGSSPVWLYDLAFNPSCLAALACTAELANISIAPLQTSSCLLQSFN